MDRIDSAYGTVNDRGCLGTRVRRQLELRFVATMRSTFAPRSIVPRNAFARPGSTSKGRNLVR